MTEKITGKTLINQWGFEPGPWFGEAIRVANDMLEKGFYENEILDTVTEIRDQNTPKTLPLRSEVGNCVGVFMTPETKEDEENLVKVRSHMEEIMRLPTMIQGVVMPDACPVGQQPGTIPVGGVVATKGTLHPGFHSSDVCCSLAVSILETKEAGGLMNTAMVATRFGPGGRTYPVSPPSGIMDEVEDNYFLRPFKKYAIDHFMTQGDGNHFLFIGRLRSTDQICIVTHHGSRGFGAKLYKAGMEAAKKHTRKVCPEAPAHNSWLDFDSRDGHEYWYALQTVREWTKANHYAIHSRIADLVGVKIAERFWNEHNFVFYKGSDVFDHAKGATPVYNNVVGDEFSRYPIWNNGREIKGVSIIPLNMSEPILITQGPGLRGSRRFAPHGAGRNFGRKEFMRRVGDRPVEEILAEETAGLDVRFYCGNPDLSELPSAYKSADFIRRQIDEWNLCTVVDEIEPIGSIMAGHPRTK